MAAPCARLQWLRGPVRKCSRGRPFNTIVRQLHMKNTLLASWVAVLVGVILLSWRFHRIVIENQYWDIPAWRSTLIWCWLSTVACAAIIAAIILWRGRKLAYVLIPASVVLGAATAIAAVSMFACHGSGCTESALVIWPGSIVYGVIAIYTLVEGIRLAKARTRGDEAV